MLLPAGYTGTRLHITIMTKTKTEAKKLYVGDHHKFRIAPLYSKDGKRNGYWYTHIYVDGKRKVVQKASEDALYDFLFDFYLEQESRPKTFDDVFEMFVEFKRARGRSESTIKDYRLYRGFIDKKIRNKALVSITEDELRMWLVSDFLKQKPKKKL